MLLAVAALPWCAAVAQDASSLSDQLRTQYKLAKTGSDASGFQVIEPGAVLVVKKGGIIGVPPGNATMGQQTYKDGDLKGLGAVARGLLGKNTRYFQVGEKVYVRKLDVNLKNDKVTFIIFECDTCNRTTEQASFKSEVVFQFPKGYLGTAEPAQVEDVISQVLAVDTGAGDQTAEVPQAPQPAQVAPDAGPKVAPPPAPPSGGTALRNDDVVKMAKAGLDDGIIIAKIKSSPSQFDTNPDALIALKTGGVSSAVLKAMTEASAQPQAASNQPAASTSGLPTSYGGFVFDGAQYRPLSPAQVNVVVGLRLRTGGNGFAVDGFSGEPPQAALPAPSELLLYQQNVDIASVHLARLVLVRSMQAYQFNIAAATVNPNPSLYPSLFGVQYNQVIPVNLWRPLEQGIPVRTEPVIERNGMFRLVPSAPLPAGRYALYFGDAVHTSEMVFTTNGGAGSAYYFEVRPGAR
jgi:hypothetical protein